MIWLAWAVWNTRGYVFFIRISTYFFEKPAMRKRILEFEFMGYGEFDERERAVQIELARDIGAVFFDRAVADVKLFADFLAGFVFGDEFKDAAFGRR